MMEHELNKDRNSGREYLRDFTRMVLAFYGGLLMISLYQQIMLYSQGILGSVLSTNLFLSAVHHLGFTAILALILSFVFNALESRKPNLGARFCRVVFLGILTIEFLLTDYFTTRYEVPAFGIPESFGMPAGYFALRLLLGVTVLSAVFYGIYSRSAKLQLWIGKMYPFTIVLFSMFLATLLSEKRPVNQNKIEKMLISWVTQSETGESRYANAALPYEIPRVSPRELVWIHGVFSGSNFDKAYEMARGLAHEGQLEQAIWLSRHILWEVPGHVDAEILLGRLYAWENHFDKSAEILEVTIRNHVAYEDAYAALLDTYFWSGQHLKALGMRPMIGEHLAGSSLLQEKLQRSLNALGEGSISATREQVETASISKAQRDFTP
ncbi:MAG: tetratricopeptide repeat protein [Robiginitalea sp.]|jgi:hypothetical protein